MNKEEILNTFLLANIPEIITQEEFDDVKKAIKDLQQENQKLKKQLENKYEKIGTLTGELLYEENTKLINQQKEFIKYLEDLIKFYKNRDSYMVADILGSYDLNNIELELLEEILQKYKSIIGDDK